MRLACVLACFALAACDDSDSGRTAAAPAAAAPAAAEPAAAEPASSAAPIEPASSGSEITVGTLQQDPLAPGRPVRLLPGPDIDDVTAPAKAHQYSRTRVERGGKNPCEAPDPGFGVHTEWVHVRPMGQFIAPRAGALHPDGTFDLLVHFHGHRPARKEVVRTGRDIALLGVSLGIGVAYGPHFADGKLLPKLVAGVEAKLSASEGRSAKLGRLALSSWSRGYDAITYTLKQPLGEKVDAIILLDSLHCSRDAERRAEQLAPYVEFARRARRGETFLFISHSAIHPPDYASTTETASYIASTLGEALHPATRRDPLGLELVDYLSTGNLHVRGYGGNGKLDHCAQFGVLPDAVNALADRWERTGG